MEFFQSLTAVEHIVRDGIMSGPVDHCQILAVAERFVTDRHICGNSNFAQIRSVERAGADFFNVRKIYRSNAACAECVIADLCHIRHHNILQ